MQRKLEKTVSAVLALVLVFALCACTVAAPKTVIDYADVESFEAALNRGENLEGKVVQFKAMELHPQSAYGYNIWAGEHLNFVSEKNPDVKGGDTLTVKATSIESIIGSWIIHYEKVENAVIGENTTSSGNEQESQETVEETVSNMTGIQRPTGGMSADVKQLETEPETTTAALATPTCETIGGDIVAFNQKYGGPHVSAYLIVKNTSDYPVTFEDVRFDYEDNDGKLLSVDSNVECIPEALKPGQTGYIYSYHYDISDIDYSNGLKFEPEVTIVPAEGFYEIDISDINASIKDSSLFPVNVVARGTNNTDKDISFARPGAVMFDKDDKVVGFCYTLESFDKGKTKSFEVSGDLLSDDYDPSCVVKVEVFAQGDSWF